MILSIYQVDTFTNRIFSGNPAAVIPLEEWLPDVLMQQIAQENNLAETAFFVKEGDVYKIRWFTPTVEVDLCGHATIASAFVIKELLKNDTNNILFDSKGGKLTVEEDNGWFTLTFPSDTYQIALPPPALQEAFSPLSLREVYKGKSDFMVVLDHEEEIRALEPNLFVLSTVPARGIIVTAPGKEADFVSRFFAPQSGIAEDPVTGSAHATLIPYWSNRLQKLEMFARQLSNRSGKLICRVRDDKHVSISGQARLFLKGEMYTN